MSDLVLTVAGQRYSGWTALRISRGITQMSGGFELTVTERFDGTTTLRPLRPGQPGTVSIDGVAVIAGNIDAVAPNYDAATHTLTLSGRDATGDLVDCAALHPSGGWHGRTLAQIATELAAPFKVPVQVQTDVGGPFPRWRIEPGETVMETLDRMARYRGVLLMSDGLGHLLITQPGTAQAPAALVLGDNVLAAHGRASLQERFSRYIVRGQQDGSDEVSGAAAAGPAGSVDDPAVPRYRPTVIVAEDQANLSACALRAQWQRAVRAARASEIVYTVAGWRANGALWQPNTLVTIRDAFMGLDETRLISNVEFSLDDSGEQTQLTVVGRHAYDPIALPQPNAHGGLW